MLKLNWHPVFGNHFFSLLYHNCKKNNINKSVSKREKREQPATLNAWAHLILCLGLCVWVCAWEAGSFKGLVLERGICWFSLCILIWPKLLKLTLSLMQINSSQIKWKKIQTNYFRIRCKKCASNKILRYTDITKH